MKRISISKLAVAVSLVMCIAVLITPRGGACNNATISSAVSLAIPVTVNSVEALAFGLLAAPDAGGPDNVWVIEPCFGVLTGPPGKDILTLDHSKGRFDVGGTPNLTVGYTVTVSADFSHSDLSLSNIIVCPTSPHNLGTGGVVPVDVGGTLTVSPGIPPGYYWDALIELDANYE